MNTRINPDLTAYRLTYASIVVLAIGAFTSISLSALSHILILFPAFYFIMQDFTMKKSRSWWALFFLVVIILLSVISNWNQIENPLRSIFKVKYFIFSLLGVFCYRRIFFNYCDFKKKKFLLHLFLIITTIATVSGLIALYSGFNPLKFKEACHPSRACGLFGMYMTYGYGISLFMVILTGMLFYKKELSQWINIRLLLIVWIINMGGLFFSYSRGAWIGFIAALPFYFLKKSIRLFFIGILAMTLVGGLCFVFSKKIQKTFLNAARVQSNTNRILLWKSSIDLFKENPVLGVGYLNFESLSKKTIRMNYKNEGDVFGGHAHNNFLEHLASTGILGFTALLIFHFFWMKEMFRRNDLMGRLVFPFIISFFISGQFQYTFGDGENLFFIMGIWMLSQMDQ